MVELAGAKSKMQVLPTHHFNSVLKLTIIRFLNHLLGLRTRSNVSFLQ